MSTKRALVEKLVESGVANAEKLVTEWLPNGDTLSPEECWPHLKRKLGESKEAFSTHRAIYEALLSTWGQERGPFPVWCPEQAEASSTHIHALQKERSLPNYQSFLDWSFTNPEQFWEQMVQKIGVKFAAPYDSVLAREEGVENAKWFSGAKLNIVESCFQGDPNSTAILYQEENGRIEQVTLSQLDKLSNRVANGLSNLGFNKGDRIAIDMTMNVECVAIYLGVIKFGGVVVSIADSFAPDEIATRLRIANAKGIFTQGHIRRAGKLLPLYEKVTKANAPKAIVLDFENIRLRESDVTWADFLVENDEFQSVVCSPQDEINILFSSGTTGDPKAIPWTHTTPIKCAMDAYIHHDTHEGNVLAWPTNIGWMMGPWLIFASLMNKATMALYGGAPLGREFGEFVQNAGVTMLGLVPSLVKAWKGSQCMEDLDWSSIRLFSSTGECSNADDYFYLMYLANYRPVIEYCGGTEVGGGYISGSLVQPASPGTFTSPCAGLNFKILDEQGKESTQGEVFLVAPSIGLSQTLLNRDHHEVYYSGVPDMGDGSVLRRHGDEMEALAGGYFRGHGRVDDTMNLGGIKVSSADIERVVNPLPGIVETAAIAISPVGGGPSELVLYVVTKEDSTDLKQLQSAMQAAVKTTLNPLFKIRDVKRIERLPRTASNKVMRRVLRKKYHEESTVNS